MTDGFVLGSVRTAVGRYGGSLADIRTDDLLGRRLGVVGTDSAEAVLALFGI